MTRRLLAIAFLLLAAAAQAGDLRSFGRGDMARQLAERAGRPFTLILWSIDCPHCKGTLRQFAALAKAEPRLDLLVVSTDNIGERQTIEAMLAAVGFGQRETWVFGDEAPERLRFEIDRRWGGEMPRTYLFDRAHKAAAFSGPVDPAAVRQWLADSFPGKAARFE